MNKEEREEYRIKRVINRIPLRKLAEYIGCSVSMVSHHELGRSNMSQEKVNKYKEYLDMNTFE